MANISSPMYSGIAFGNYESGTYGGSIHQSVHPTLYQYWYLHSTELSDASIQNEFNLKFEEFLNTTTVNGTLSLKEFLHLVELSDQKKLDIVYEKFNVKIAKGDHTQPLSVLIFPSSKLKDPVELDPYSCHLDGPHAHALFSLVRKFGVHFKSQVPDAFMLRHYSRFVE